MTETDTPNPTQPLILRGDARTLPLADNSIDACVTDPPYALRELPAGLIENTLREWLNGNRTFTPGGSGGFMSHRWDNFVPPPAAWDETMRVLKPGSHILAFCAPRTVDLLTLSMRLAGLRIVDQLAWIFSGGMPKGINVAKAIDKTAGAAREVAGERIYSDGHTPRSKAGQGYRFDSGPRPLTAPATPEAAAWEGWHSQLKPSHEVIVLAQVPLAGTVAGNVLAWGTGALNADACRVAHDDDLSRYERSATSGFKHGGIYGGGDPAVLPGGPDGRFPPNLLLSHLPVLGEDGEPAGDACADGCQPGCPIDEMNRQSGTRTGGGGPIRRFADKFRDTYGDFVGQSECVPTRGADSGGAARFFPCFRYEPKAPSSQRPNYNGYAHSTVKPTALMAWLATLITPPGGVVLDQFAGSGSTLQAAAMLGFRSIGVELDAANLPLIRQRLDRRRTTRATTPPVKPVDGQIGMFGEEVPA